MQGHSHNDSFNFLFSMQSLKITEKPIGLEISLSRNNDTNPVNYLCVHRETPPKNW